ncbi:MAG: hypothetical protein K0Q72_4125, partial [Armatimonadetes bacterium]|nr:hypothetical protein [Armatimonadota bacterium]
MSSYTRREFARFALSVFPAAGLLGGSRPLFAADGPDSKV